MHVVVLLGAVWGLRTVPAGDDAWRVRWEGGGAIVVDGRRVEGGDVRLPSDRPHALLAGARVVQIEPRASDPCAPLRFAVLGDGRAALDGVGPSAYWAGILTEALATRPAFVLNTGDLVKNGERREEWDAFLRTLPPWPPLLAVPGNHDRGSWFYRLGLAPDRAYAWHVGPVLLVGIDLERGDTDRVIARVDALLSATEAPWKIVLVHRPPWSRGNHGSDSLGVNARLVPVFDRHGVDVVFGGHDHNYERFCASRGAGDDRRCTPPGEGTVYVVTGGAATFTNPLPGISQRVGAALAAADATADRAFSGAHHFVRVDIVGGRLDAVAWRTRTGNLRPPGAFDRFILEKAVPGCD